MKCIIFRCSKKEEMYLYVPYQDDESTLVNNLPEELGKWTGKLEKVMDLEITPGQKLARAKVEDVLASLEEKGFYIQMPPNELLRKDESMLNNPSDSF